MANGTPSPNSTFDLAERLKTRQERKVLINGREFHPARETTESRAQDRKLGRDQARVSSELEKASENDAFDDLEKLQVEQEELLYSIVANRLVDDQNAKPEIGWLAEHLPIGEVTPLLEFIDSDGEPATADPS